MKLKGKKWPPYYHQWAYKNLYNNWVHDSCNPKYLERSKRAPSCGMRELEPENLVAGQCQSRFHTCLTANIQRNDAMQGNNPWERLFPPISILVRLSASPCCRSIYIKMAAPIVNFSPFHSHQHFLSLPAFYPVPCTSRTNAIQPKLWRAPISMDNPSLRAPESSLTHM